MDAIKHHPFFFILFSIILLSGCTAGVTVATSGAQAVYNRNHLRQQVSDNYITMQAYRKIYTDTDDFKKANISISTYDNDILLTGQVTNPKLSQEAERIVKTIQGVDAVYNHIAISAPISALTHMSDDWITTKVKSKLIAMNDIDPSHIKVVTDNGTVYLMGIVFPTEADTALDIARNTQGVQDVVEHFYYMKISKMRS